MRLSGLFGFFGFYSLSGLFALFSFTPLEIMPRCSAAGLDFRIIPAGFNAPLEFLTGFTLSLILWIGIELRWNLMLPMEQFPRSTGRVALEVSR
jgi:hypothetical protein